MQYLFKQGNPKDRQGQTQADSPYKHTQQGREHRQKSIHGTGKKPKPRDMKLGTMHDNAMHWTIAV